MQKSTHKGVNQRSKDVKQMLQQRPESPTVTLTCITHMPGESYRRRFRSLLLCFCDVFQVTVKYQTCIGLCHVAQLAVRRIEKPGAIRTRVRVSGAAKGFSSQSQLTMQTLLRCSHRPPYAIVCIGISRARYKSLLWQPCHCVDTMHL